MAKLETKNSPSQTDDRTRSLYIDKQIHITNIETYMLVCLRDNPKWTTIKPGVGGSNKMGEIKIRQNYINIRQCLVDTIKQKKLQIYPLATSLS